MSTREIVNRESPASDLISLCVPEIGGNEWRYVKECLDTNWVSTAGEYVERFERAIADVAGVRNAVATVNGTAALHLALIVAGVQPDDEVLVSTLTFIAPANAIRYVGAWPVFVDAEPDYWQMDTSKLEEFVTKKCIWREGGLYNRITGRRIRAIIPVHILGHPVEMNSVVALARKYDLKIIEDATESLGARFDGTPVGHIGDIACFSFNGNKLITTGGGGMIVTDDDRLAARARYLSTQAKDNSIEYIHETVGFNYRLTNIQAALGVAQTERLNSYIAAKRSIAAVYEDTLSEVPGITTMGQAPWAESVYWMYTVLVDDQTFGLGSRQLMNSLSQSGVQTRPLWQPVHLSPAHKGSCATSCEIAEDLNRRALSLPCSVGLTESSQSRVIESIKALAARRATVCSI